MFCAQAVSLGASESNHTNSARYK